MSQEAIPVKLVIVGDGAIGKTCILVSFSENKFPRQYVPTIFDNSSTTLKVDNKIVNLGLWDTAGQEEYARLRPLAYANTDVFLIAFSVAQRSSFLNAIKWYPEVRKAVPEAVILIVGNKIDLRDGLPQNNQRFVYQNQAKDQLKSLNCVYLQCSALTRKGLRQVFETAVRRVLMKKGNNKYQFTQNEPSATCDCQLI